MDQWVAMVVELSGWADGEAPSLLTSLRAIKCLVCNCVYWRCCLRCTFFFAFLDVVVEPRSVHKPLGRAKFVQTEQRHQGLMCHSIVILRRLWQTR